MIIMNTIIKNCKKEINIKKSRFIGIAIEITTKEEAENIIKSYKEQYKDATHVCYVYIVNNNEKASDDGEPKGTAGIPMLNLLKKKSLTNILCIVIRYFGGIKLGANGLLRAYVDTELEVLNNNIVPLINGYYLKIKFPYSLEKEVSHLLKNCTITNKQYDKNIVYELECDIDIYSKLQSMKIIDTYKEQLIKKLP